MKITSVAVKKNLKDNSSIKGFADIVLDDCLAIFYILIIEDNSELFIAMPCRCDDNGNYYDIVHPTNSLACKMLSDSILDEFKKIY